MPTTTNFGWTTPADTDLVSQGAAAMRTLGGNIDTSLVDLKGGTTGQVLAKATNTDLDYTWTNHGWTELATGSLSGTTVSLTGISSMYEDLRLVINGATFAGAGRISLRFGTSSIDTGTSYQATYISTGSATWTGAAAATSLGGAATASSWGLQVFDIPEANRTTGPKPIWARSSQSATTTGEILFGVWNGGRISLINIIGSLSMTGGTYTLYGRQ